MVARIGAEEYLAVLGTMLNSPGNRMPFPCLEELLTLRPGIFKPE
jgi:hypothetical protein